jgi:hypothetical protein
MIVGAKWVVERGEWVRREMIGEARWVAEQFQFHLTELVNGRPDLHLRCFSETHRMRLKAH